MNHSEYNAELLELVKAEVELIKQNVSADKLAKLNEKTFDGGHGVKCIYGQLFGESGNTDATNFKVAMGFNKYATQLEICIYDYKRHQDGIRIIRYLKGKNKTLRNLGK